MCFFIAVHVVDSLSVICSAQLLMQLPWQGICLVLVADWRVF
jgi:hypothetical protein